MQGGGDVSFELQCLGLLQVYPSAGKLKKWIKPVSSGGKLGLLKPLLSGHNRTV